jgi:hypothetical protein
MHGHVVHVSGSNGSHICIQLILDTFVDQGSHRGIIRKISVNQGSRRHHQKDFATKTIRVTEVVNFSLSRGSVKANRFRLTSSRTHHPLLPHAGRERRALL